MSRDFQEVRQEILAMHQRVQEETYYDLLGVQLDADTAMISSKFRELAKKWHVDRFSQYELGAEKQKVQEIFSALNTAHRTLTDSDKRAEYDFEIDGGPDINTILQAESDFRRGKTMLQAGSYKGAHECFKEAHEKKDDELEYLAHMLYTEFLLIPKNDEGIVKTQKRGREIFEELDKISAAIPEKDWLLTFLGVVGLGIGKEREAEGLFQEALMANSNYSDAKRQLRLLRMRRRNAKKKGGFLSRLFGK